MVDLPLGVAQEARLFASSVRGNGFHSNPSSIMSTGIWFVGAVEVDAILRALTEFIERHAALRTALYRNPNVSEQQHDAAFMKFCLTGVVERGHYLQAIHEKVPVELKTLDLSSLSRTEISESIRSIHSQGAAEPFDYHKPSFLRARLIKTEAQRHLLVVYIDHLVFDGFSVRIFQREIRELYADFTGASTGRLRRPGLSFPDFCVWQDNAICSSYFEADQRYWAVQWRAFAASVAVFRDRSYWQAGRDLDVGIESVRADGVDWTGLRQFASRNGSTLFMVFFAAFVMALRLQTENDRIAVWTHFANRRLAGTIDSIGFYVNSHLLSLEVRKDDSLLNVLHEARTTIVRAAQHQQVPLEIVPEAVSMRHKGDGARPLLDLHVMTERPEFDPFEVGGVTIETAELPELPVRRFSAFGVYVFVRSSSITITANYPRKKLSQPEVNAILNATWSIAKTGWTKQRHADG